MTEPRNDDRSQARREAATLLNVDIDRMSPADGLRIDMISALRLVIDHEQGCVLSGGSADLGKLNVAVQSLIALLPGRELPAPESQREDPRQAMWEIYKTMRERGELSLKALPEGDSQHRIDELEAEVARLRARLAGRGARPPSTWLMGPTSRRRASWARATPALGAVPTIHRGDRRRSSRAGCSNPRTGRRRPGCSAVRLQQGARLEGLRRGRWHDQTDAARSWPLLGASVDDPGMHHHPHGRRQF